MFCHPITPGDNVDGGSYICTINLLSLYSSPLCARAFFLFTVPWLLNVERIGSSCMASLFVVRSRSSLFHCTRISCPPRNVRRGYITTALSQVIQWLLLLLLGQRNRQ